MDIRKLQRVIVDGLEDVKAQNIAVFNTEHLSALFERVIIATGTSNRQTKSLSSSVRDAVKKAGYPVPRLEGESNGEWIIIDCGAAVVHVMQPSIRDYYHLEEIWGDKPVNMKLASATTRLVKASEEPEVRRAPATKKAGAKATIARKAPASRAPTGKAPSRTPAKAPPRVAAKSPAATSARKPAATSPASGRKAPAKKVTAPRGGVVTRVVGVKAPAAKKPAAKPVMTKPATKSAVTKVAARTTPATSARKPAAKKSPARKSTSRT
jgi:ribosome-associated protein